MNHGGIRLTIAAGGQSDQGVTSVYSRISSMNSDCTPFAEGNSEAMRCEFSRANRFRTAVEPLLERACMALSTAVAHEGAIIAQLRWLHQSSQPTKKFAFLSNIEHTQTYLSS